MAEFKRVANIIPLTRVSFSGSQIFSYLVPLKLQDQIRPGQLVKIPFGKRTILGVISSFEMHRLASETKGLKSIIDFLDATPVITDKNLAVASWLANYYICSLGLVVKAMLPKFVKKPKAPLISGYEKFNPDFVLTEYQRLAVSQISMSLGKQATYLLHGIIGSGKTEVYMQVIDRILEGGKQVIILVPEISLTQQAIERFARRFGLEKIAVLHSKLKGSERLWMWQQIRDQSKQIIIGPRSAIFAPVRNLGLIVIDEEHDSSFKQSDQNPKYHALEVARQLSRLWQCPLILGDATPQVETYYQAGTGKIKLLNLPFRIKVDMGFPQVKVIDMRQEIAAGNYSIFSEILKSAILENLKAGRQIILYLNRRGTAPIVMCRDCAFIPTCANCSVSLVWHKSVNMLICHHCGRRCELPLVCPECGGYRIKYFGLGTQKVEEELKKFLTEEYRGKSVPQVARMDSDTTGQAPLGAQIYKNWVAGKINILIGTQMISKGWDVAKVGCIGVVLADTLLYLPDFRSNERTFQALTWVAGRTGRGQLQGRVYFQTFKPDNYSISAAKTHNYEGFFKAEILERQKHNYPPFVRLIKLTARHQNHERAAKRAWEISEELKTKAKNQMQVLGPFPGFISKIRGRYQYHVVLKLKQDLEFDVFSLFRDLPNYIDIDVDPQSLL